MGGDVMGDVYGLYKVADTLLTGTDIFELNETITPALKYRFVDTGAVGIKYAPQAWDSENYSHNTRAFYHVILKKPPYVDEKAFSEVEVQFKEYVHRMISYGYNGIIIRGFLEYINFDLVGSGTEIYDKESDYRKRHLVVREKFGELFHYAHQMGIKVVFRTDMVALTHPLKHYFEKRFGSIDVSSINLWKVYRLGLEEFFDIFPYTDGIMIRIGEAGGMYDLDGWLYFSSLELRSVESVRTMLSEFINVAEEKNKKIFLRSWSLGVGEIGYMHVDPESYEKILDKISSPNLIVSTKYNRGDFYSYLPLNPTLKTGAQERIIEFQARREFEGFNSFPNYTGPLYQTALSELLEENPHITGLWLWTQNGGPLMAGPLSLYPFHGFWQLIDLNVYVMAQLAWNPEADLNPVTETWVRKMFKGDIKNVTTITELMFHSREPILKGLYLSDFARKMVVTFGLEPPPIIWVWDIVPGSDTTFSLVYFVCKDSIDKVIAEGFEAVRLTRQMKALLNKDTFEKNHPSQKLIESLDYEENLIETLAWFRKTFLSYYRWLDTGDHRFYKEWMTSYETYKEKEEAHSARYGNNLDFPAYNFFAAQQGMAQMERNKSMTLLSRIILLLTSCILIGGSSFFQYRIGSFPGKKGLRAVLISLISPCDLKVFTRFSAADITAFCFLPFMIIAAGLMTFSYFLSLTFAVWTIGTIFVFLAAIIIIHPGSSTTQMLTLVGALLSSLLCMNTLFMSITSVRGPLFFWYRFWTDSDLRIQFFFLALVIVVLIVLVFITTSRQVLRLSKRAVLGKVLISLGILFFFNGLVISQIGFDSFLTNLNNEMAIFPFALSKSLGFTTHLNITPYFPLYSALGGIFLAGFGWLITKTRPSRNHYS
jgi:hypothetical protein